MQRSFYSLRALALSSLMGGAVLGMSACSGKMSKSECEKTDFYEIGLKDGKKGASADRLREITEMCSAQGVAVPAEKYTYGRQVGLVEYCDAGQAEKDAKKGVVDSVCHIEKVPPYETAYQRALGKQREAKAEDLKKLQESREKLQQKEGELQSQLNQIDQQKGEAAPVQQ